MSTSRATRRVPGVGAMSVLLDAMDHLPAVVFNGRLDVLAVTALERALHAPVLDLPGRPDSARFLFLDEPAAPTIGPPPTGRAAPTAETAYAVVGER